MTLLQRFLRKVQLPSPSEPNGCWLWTGSMRNEYGSIKVNGSTRYAHRVAYELYRGELSPDLKLLHSCDNQACVNPSHLTQDTQLANVRDGIQKGRMKPYQQTRPVGPADVDAEAVRQDARNGMSQRRIAAKYRMALTSVRRVLGRIGK